MLLSMLGAEDDAQVRCALSCVYAFIRNAGTSKYLLEHSGLFLHRLSKVKKLLEALTAPEDEKEEELGAVRKQLTSSSSSVMGSLALSGGAPASPSIGLSPAAKSSLFGDDDDEGLGLRPKPPAPKAAPSPRGGSFVLSSPTQHTSPRGLASPSSSPGTFSSAGNTPGGSGISFDSSDSLFAGTTPEGRSRPALGTAAARGTPGPPKGSPSPGIDKADRERLHQLWVDRLVQQLRRYGCFSLTTLKLAILILRVL
jgi:hypothetical protein